MLTLCGGCLASDRILKPITKHFEILDWLIEDKKEHFNEGINRIRFCWECSSLLNKLNEFHFKVNIAQSFLKRTNRGEVFNFTPLSNLSETIIKNEYDLILSEGDDEKFSKSVIKEEFNHSDHDYETNYDSNDYKSDVSDDHNVDDVNDVEDDIKFEEGFMKIDWDSEFVGQVVVFKGKTTDNKTIPDNNIDKIRKICSNNVTIKDKKGNENDRKLINCKNSVTIRDKKGNIVSNNNKISSKGNNKDKQIGKTHIKGASVNDLITNKDITIVKVNPEEVKVEFNGNEVREESCVNVVRQRRSCKGQVQKKKFNKIRYSELKGEEVMKYVEVSEIDFDSCRRWFESKWNSEPFVSKPYKCFHCLKVFGSERAFLMHKKKRHPMDGDNYLCDICNRGFKQKLALHPHLKTHKHKYTCKLCNEEFFLQSQISYHVQKHSTRFQCPCCGMIFEWQRDFYQHYNALHAFFTCDYCGKTKREKKALENHILTHTMKYCKICDVHFNSFKGYIAHNKMKHLKMEVENTYCVECDMKFENTNRYKYHLRTAVKHIGKVTGKYPCPECKKVYAKKLTMKYHYDHYHLKQTRFYCELCDKYMLNPFSLRQHIASVHDKIKPPKNKICDICGRGFSTSKVLIHHKRTHTGERPYKCEYCTAAFAQKYAMKTHMRTQHKVYMHS